ncbi:MAG: NACHT domain-containing protein, partial [Anaerolineae bacterium]|nr:NACHT domain-containing protein [Anaerolineae bacterium]
LYVLGILAGIGLWVLTLVFPRFVSDEPVFRRHEDIPISETQRTQNRNDMLALVEKIWINGFLDHVLNEMDALRLPLAFAEPGKVLEKPGMADYHLPDSAAILQTFRDLGRRLVILGEPGSGKTVTLLQLAQELIGEARTDDSRPVPIVLALSSWAAGRLPFEDWLRQEIRERYDVPSKIADDLVLGEQLVYLLDGLDEVAEEYRNTCVEYIKVFVDTRKTAFVLCCRRREYETLSARLDIPGQIVIQPLTETQIDDYLNDSAFAGLRTLRRDSPIVQDFARIPFMLNTTAVVTRDQPETALQLALKKTDDPAHVRDYFLEEYVSRRLREHTNTRYSDVGHTRSRLKWLAQQLIAHDETDFYIENLQFDWLPNNGSRVEIRRCLRYSPLLYGLAVFFTCGLITSLVFGLLGGLVIGVGFGLLTGIAFDLGGPEIRP